jgi:hypothetical protein
MLCVVERPDELYLDELLSVLGGAFPAGRMGEGGWSLVI